MFRSAMDRESLLKRIQDLERETVRLRADIGARPSGWRRVLSKLGMFLISYWALMSFLAAIATATYVKFAYNIDYFESYRNASSVKRISEFHREMGDEMFLRSNWQQAVASYQAALAANPANSPAALGIVKAQVFQPEQGRKFTDPAVVGAKLRKLRALYPDDPQVAWLEAVQSYGMEPAEQTMARCDELLAEHRGFPGGYLLKAYLQQANADFTGAAATLRQLLVVDPENGAGHANIGYCYLFTGQPDLAREHLKLGRQREPNMVNAISLAEACRMDGEAPEARALLDGVERVLKLPGIENEAYTAGDWLWNHLPEHEGDGESVKSTITCVTMDQKRAVLRVSQGMLAAGERDFAAAAEAFRECLRLEPPYREFLVNKLRATAFAGKGLITEHREALTDWAEGLAEGDDP